MDLSFTAEQDLLRATLRKALNGRYGFAARTAAARGAGWRPEIWRWLAEDLGLVGVGSDDRDMRPIEQMIVAEELGYALALEPYAEAAVIAAAALAHWRSPRAAPLADAIARGRAVVAFAWDETELRNSFGATRTVARDDGEGWRLDGAKCAVAAAPHADWLLVPARIDAPAAQDGGLTLFLVEAAAAGVGRARYPAIDGRRAADISLTDVGLPRDAVVGGVGKGLAITEKLVDLGTMALCAEAVGVMRRAFDETFAHLGARQQFGQRLCDFQALQHRMADMRVRIELARAAALLAALHAPGVPAARARAASAAKVTISQALRFVGQNAIQLHGGMGMMEDLAVGHAFKRLTMIEGEFGTGDYHLARYAHLARG